MNNGLTPGENCTLAKTRHTSAKPLVLILRGLDRTHFPKETPEPVWRMTPRTYSLVTSTKTTRGLARLKDLIRSHGMTPRDYSINADNPNNAHDENYIKSRNPRTAHPPIEYIGGVHLSRHEAKSVG